MVSMSWQAVLCPVTDLICPEPELVTTLPTGQVWMLQEGLQLGLVLGGTLGPV